MTLANSLSLGTKEKTTKVARPLLKADEKERLGLHAWGIPFQLFNLPSEQKELVVYDQDSHVSSAWTNSFFFSKDQKIHVEWGAGQAHGDKIFNYKVSG